MIYVISRALRIKLMSLKDVLPHLSVENALYITKQNTNHRIIFKGRTGFKSIRTAYKNDKMMENSNIETVCKMEVICFILKIVPQNKS